VKARSRSRGRTLLHGLVWCWLAAVGAAVAEDRRYERGLLFEIVGEYATSCFLFGTIHSEDPRVLKLPPKVQSAFNDTKVFVMEAIPDAQAIVTSMIGMVYTDGRTLESVIGRRLYVRAMEALAERGMTEEAVKDFKPWAVATLLSVPQAESGEFLDIRLYNNAVAAGKEIFGLESMEEQLAVFDTLSAEDQIALLRETLDALDHSPKVFERLLSAYLDRDLAALAALGDEYLGGADPQLAGRFEEAALHLRNERMSERMESFLRAGDCFIAVGALHLPGEGGILQRLRRKGFSIRPRY
jgi:uncharacterized protein YbaP (TraB family)